MVTIAYIQTDETNLSSTLFRWEKTGSFFSSNFSLCSAIFVPFPIRVRSKIETHFRFRVRTSLQMNQSQRHFAMSLDINPRLTI